DSLPRTAMAETNEPKKETVRIKLPPRHASSASNSDSGPRDTIRINLPSRVPSGLSASSQTFKPPPPPPSAAARAPVLPGLGQPPITAPEPITDTAPISIEAESASDAIESIPVPLCWALVGVSALIFIIQVWTYFS